MALIQCSQCGQTISDKAVRCPKCGASVVSPQQSDSYNSNPVENRNSGSGGKKTAIIIVSAVAAILAIVVVFLLVRNNRSDYLSDEYTEDYSYDVEDVVAETIEHSESTLEMVIRYANQGLPEEVEEGVTMEKITLEGDYITYTCSVDEDLYSISDIRATQNEIKRNMKEYLFGTDNSNVNEFRSICKSNHKGAAFKYVGRKTGNSHTIYIKPSEIED